MSTNVPTLTDRVHWWTAEQWAPIRIWIVAQLLEFFRCLRVRRTNMCTEQVLFIVGSVGPPATRPELGNEAATG